MRHRRRGQAGRRFIKRGRRSFKRGRRRGGRKTGHIRMRSRMIGDRL
jgi:hypothetical protein